MKRRIIGALSALALAVGIAVAVAPTAALASYGPCNNTNGAIAYLQETYGTYALGFTGTGAIGATATEVAKPGWEVCLYPHKTNWNIYLYNGNELGAQLGPNNSCTGNLIVRAAGTISTAWTDIGVDSNHEVWTNDYCGSQNRDNEQMAGLNNGTSLFLCGSVMDCSGSFLKWKQVNTS